MAKLLVEEPDALMRARPDLWEPRGGNTRCFEATGDYDRGRFGHVRAAMSPTTFPRATRLVLVLVSKKNPAIPF